MSISRRNFIEASALGGLATAATAAPAAESMELNAKGVPTRVLGRTGARVSILAMGGGSRFLSYSEEDKALAAMNHAVDLGITYLDTAYAYGSGLSETRVGKIMATRRKEVFLATKIAVRNGDEAMRIIEGSLKRLQSNPDVIHIHQLGDAADLAAIEAPDGVLKRLYQLRDQKVCRFIGITCHNDPTVLKAALEHNDFDMTQMALNAALVGMKTAPKGQAGMVINPDMKTSFEHIALPVAVKKKMGIVAMKIYAADGLVGQVPAPKLLGYSLTLPVALCVIGMPKPELIDENVAIAKSYRPMPKKEMESLAAALSSKNKVALDRYFANHSDQYA